MLAYGNACWQAMLACYVGLPGWHSCELCLLYYWVAGSAIWVESAMPMQGFAPAWFKSLVRYCVAGRTYGGLERAHGFRVWVCLCAARGANKRRAVIAMTTVFALAVGVFSSSSMAVAEVHGTTHCGTYSGAHFSAEAPGLGLQRPRL